MNDRFFLLQFISFGRHSCEICYVITGGNVYHSLHSSFAILSLTQWYTTLKCFQFNVEYNISVMDRADILHEFLMVFPSFEFYILDLWDILNGCFHGQDSLPKVLASVLAYFLGIQLTGAIFTNTKYPILDLLI